MIYHKIYDFCKVKAHGTARKNGQSIPPRVEWIINTLTDLNINYRLDSFTLDNQNLYHNIILRGDSNIWVVAHHDIVNPDIDNANDNSASVINAIALKTILPHINIALLDGEEVGGIGSQRLSDELKTMKFGEVDWILNLELTGKGGEYFFIGDYPGKLSDHIKSVFNCPVHNTPFNDSVIFRKNGFDSCVINPLPRSVNEKSEILNESILLDYSYLNNCHRPSDTLDSISVEEMRSFTEGVLVKIIKTYEDKQKELKENK
jgi:hypothetical protein